MGRVDMGKDAEGKRKILTFYGKSRPEVSEKLLKSLNEIKTGTFVKPSKLTMDLWLQTWLTDYAKPSVKHSTYNMNTGIITIRQTINRLKNFNGGETKTSIVFDTPKTKYSNRTLPLQELFWNN